MKTKLLVTAILVISAALFIISGSGAKESGSSFVPPPSPQPDSFLTGALDVGWDLNLQRLRQMNFNVWHIYLGDTTDAEGKHIPNGWRHIGALDDYLYADTTTQYIQQVSGILNNNKAAGLLSYIQRPKIERLVFAQRSDYQCEYITPNQDTSSTVDWWYAFNNSDQSHDVDDSGGRVKHYSVLTDNTPLYIVSGLRANYEQVTVAAQNPLYADANFSWQIKPRIRIKPEDATPSTRVCRIELYDFDGNLFKKINLYGRHFLVDSNSTYNGEYIEEFNYQQGDTTLTIDNGIDWNPNQHTSWPNQVDIRVFWYQECDIWLDYIRVDNDIAHRLLGNTPDPEFDNWIRWESQDVAASGNGVYRFYVDEFDYNMMPGLKYLQRKIKEYNLNQSIGMCVYSAFVSFPSLQCLSAGGLCASQFHVMSY